MDTDQITACKRLLSAVVHQALMDSQLRPISLNNEPQQYALTALQFLFVDSDQFLDFLDIDPMEFRKRLVDQMHGDSHVFDRTAKHHFCQNYAWWYRKQLDRLKKLNEN